MKGGSGVAGEGVTCRPEPHVVLGPHGGVRDGLGTQESYPITHTGSVRGSTHCIRGDPSIIIGFPNTGGYSSILQGCRL